MIVGGLGGGSGARSQLCRRVQAAGRRDRTAGIKGRVKLSCDGLDSNDCVRNDSYSLVEAAKRHHYDI